MNIRLVAYRPATSTDTVDTTYELELTKAPNISLNFQFSDIKNPETRKASFSQTFRLPFTKKNNEFFQNWYNVNLEKLVFSTREKFNAALFVDTVPQFEGYLQLKAVYQKAEQYEVVLMSNPADLFSAIGERRLKDVFLNDDGSYSNELNHLFNKDNITDSWDGSSTNFTSDCDTCSGASLRDADAGVQKIMYPLTVTRPNFWYSQETKEYLNLDDTEIASLISENGSYQGSLLAQSLAVNIEQLRPAIQIKELFKLIFAKSGFSYQSTFIDGDYFGKIFMTLGGFLESETLPTPYASGQVYPTGFLTARVNSATETPYWVETAGAGTGTIGYPFFTNCLSGADCGTASVEVPTPITFKATNEIDDDSNVWNDGSIFTKISPAISTFTINAKYKVTNVVPVCGDEDYINVAFYLYDANTGSIMNDSLQNILFEVNGSSSIQNNWSITFDVSNIALGTQFSIGIQAPAMKASNCLGSTPFVDLFRQIATNNYGTITCTWMPFNDSQFGKEILIPSCIDPDITQKQFLQDIIQRFNLILTTDPDDATNIIIEPYEQYISGGTIRHWTNKIDTSKEIVVKDTTTLQKKIIHLTDLEDEDLMNKSIKETAPTLNVYGKYFEENKTNQFATGELKNSSLFAPYINQAIFKIGSDAETDLSNVGVQYEISYTVDDQGAIQQELKATKPKLFYYCGATTDIKTNEGVAQTIYLHQITVSTGAVNARSFTKYPVCTAWDIKTNEAAPTYEYTLTSANKCLYWDFAPPQANLRIFNYDYDLELVSNLNTLYMLYWRSYFNSLYSEEARIMTAYFNLTSVDLFKFAFNDEIFIKDAWWRIQKIENYQVGQNASTKVTLLKKIDDAVALPQGCDYVVSTLESNGIFTWCPADTPGCTPNLATTGAYAQQACCYGVGGEPMTWITPYESQGLYPCAANTGSLPMRLKSHLSTKSLFNQGQLKNLISGKLGGLKNPFVIGTNSGKSRSSLIPSQGDDMVIKYKNDLIIGPPIIGESHRMVLLGYTEGTTKGYAYPQGNSLTNTKAKMYMPPDSNVQVSIKGISTIVGGTNATYIVGVTESFSYQTTFVFNAGQPTQIGTAGGVMEWQLRDSALSPTSTLEITTNSTSGYLEFGLKDSLADTKKAWSLVVELNIQNLANLQLPFGDTWAIWQSGGPIGLQNYDRLIWN